jgi:Prolipoprotein diacylglyceryltransferase
MRKSTITKKPGYLTGGFLVLYSVIRFLLEYFREPDAPLVGMLTRGQFYSIFMLFAGIFCLYYAKTKTDSNSVFCS